MSKNSNLTKEGLKGFSISFNRAKSMGITDDDLEYIYELDSNRFRISIRDKTRSVDNKNRHTKTEYSLIDAIRVKWSIINAISKAQENATYLEINEKSSIEESDNKSDAINQYLDFTVREGIEKFFSDRALEVEKGLIELSTHENNQKDYQSRYMRDWELLDKLIIEISDDDAQDYVNYLNELTPVKKITKNNKLSVNTVSGSYQLMHLFFEHFRKVLKVIKINPFTDVVNKPKYTPKDQNYLTSDEIKLVLKELEKKNIRFQVLINLFLETGLRIEEILAIKYTDINRTRLTIKIERALIKSRITNKLIIKDLKNEGSEREISISSFTLDLIDKLRRFKEECGFIVTNSDHIFTAWEEMELISPERYTAEFREFMKDLGFKDLPFRNLRHTSVTFMLQGETNLKAVKKRFGWSKDSTVFNIYNQSNLDEDRKLLEKFEEEFRNTLGATFSELYCICVNRFNNKRKLNNIIQKILDKPMEEINMEEDVKVCQNYLFELYPAFSKIAQIDKSLDDEEVEAIFKGFKDIYKKIKIEGLETC